MNAKQYEKAIATLGLSQVKAGEFLGISARQSRRLVAGDYPVPRAIVLLLAVMIAKKLSPEKVEALL